MDLTKESFLVVCTQTGTVLNGKHCVVLPDSFMTSEEWDEFQEMSDSEVCEIAKKRGTKVSVIGPGAVALGVRRAQARMRQYVEGLQKEILDP